MPSAERNKVQLFLGVGRCVEKAAHQRSQELLEWMMKYDKNVPDELVGKYELLRRFIEVTDFQRLRGEFPDLDGRASILLTLQAGTSPGQFLLKAVVPKAGEAQLET
jgi:hypothetical protein